VRKLLLELCRTFSSKARISDAVMPPPVIIVTNCTNRKRSTESTVSLSEAQRRGTLECVARRWVEALEKVPLIDEAQNVYGGRSISEAKNATEIVNGELYVVSAGLGLIHASERIPAYNLTVSEGPGSLAPFLSNLGKRPADWWSALINEFGPTRSLRWLIETNKKARVLLALPSGYLELIAQDLDELTTAQVAQIRIITSKLGEDALPARLRRLVLPYDERLEGSTYAGTRTDFPQRALRHFVTELGGHNLDPATADDKVWNTMEALKKPVLPMRVKKSNDEISALLRANWDQYGGSSSRLLRFLRDDALVACEQSRFRGLWLQMQEELRMRGEEWQR
jgi:hypothetical protein